MAQLPLGIGLPDSAVFGTFHPGRNASVAAAARTTALGTGEPVLYLYGAQGSGKTHLLQAACHAAHESGRRAALLPLVQVAELGVEAIEGWELYDLVCVDDIHTIAGNREWEAALFTLFNALRGCGGHWIATGVDVPATLQLTLPDLVSRLGAGPVFQLHELDDEGRVLALTLRASQRGLDMPAEVGQFLLKHLPRDMRTLYAALEVLDRASLAQQRRLTVPFVKSVLGV